MLVSKQRTLKGLWVPHTEINEEVVNFMVVTVETGFGVTFVIVLSPDYVALGEQMSESSYKVYPPAHSQHEFYWILVT